jgi:hypothetical protein
MGCITRPSPEKARPAGEAAGQALRTHETCCKTYFFFAGFFVAFFGLFFDFAIVLGLPLHGFYDLDTASGAKPVAFGDHAEIKVAPPRKYKLLLHPALQEVKKKNSKVTHTRNHRC